MFRDDGSWTEEAVLRAPNGQAEDRFGFSVDVSGDYVTVGALFEDGPTNTVNEHGAAYVFHREGTSWDAGIILRQPTPASGERFGNRVDLDGDRLVVGAYWENGAGSGVNPADDNNRSQSGAVYAFTRADTNSWIPEAYLKHFANDGRDKFGSGVVLRGNRLAVSAAEENGCTAFAERDPTMNAGIQCGAVLMFMHGANGWETSEYLTAQSPSDRDYFGNYGNAAMGDDFMAVGAARTDSLVVGDPANDEGADTGSVQLYH